MADLPFERELADALRVVNVAVQSALDALGAMDEAALVVSLANLEAAARAVRRRARRVLKATGRYVDADFDDEGF